MRIGKAWMVVLLTVVVAFSALTFVFAEEVTPPSEKDRAMGAIMGVLIGDALGVGCHWYYNLEAKEKDCGYITDYMDPVVPGSNSWASINKLRYDAGLRAGGPSQTGQFIIMLLESVAAEQRYVQDDYTARLDEFFKTIDGTPYSGRYTDAAIRRTWAHRDQGVSWDDPNVGADYSTSEGAQRAVILSARYHGDSPAKLARRAYNNIRLTYSNGLILSESTTYALVVQALIQGVPVEELGAHMSDVYDYEVVQELVPTYDTIGAVGAARKAINNPGITIDPPYLASLVYGQDCYLSHLLPAAYYFLNRFPNDFEKAILAAVNGGGNNMARAALTGGLLGASVGLQGIPDRFIEGLEDHEHLLELAEIVTRDYPGQF